MNKDNKFQKFIFWFLSFTWGLPITLVGSVIAIILMIGGKKPKKFGWCVYFNVGKYWGGLEFGPFFLVDSSDDFGIKCHEHGHGFQNIIMGPFFPFLVSFRSGARYWLREIKKYALKIVYTVAICFFILAISFMLIGFGQVGQVLCMKILGVVCLIYSAFFSIWLIDETVKHKDLKKYPDYDSFWVEGQATKWGEKFIKQEILVDKS